MTAAVTQAITTFPSCVVLQVAVAIVPEIISYNRQMDHAYVQPRTCKHPVSNLSRSIYEGCSVNESWADALQASHDARNVEIRMDVYQKCSLN